jgi:hypothetical protein
MTPPHSPTLSDILTRFVTDGLIETIDSYQTGQLPLHRLNWELASRINSLTELRPTHRVATVLRWLHRDIDRIHTHTTTNHTPPTPTEQEFLNHTLHGMRRILTTTHPHQPHNTHKHPTGHTPTLATHTPQPSA